jgi:hypothetical protein
MGTPADHHREGHHEVKRTSTRRRQRAPDRAEGTEAVEPTPYIPSPEFARAYANPHNELGPIATRWSERGIAEWLLPINSPREFRHRYPPRNP